MTQPAPRPVRRVAVIGAGTIGASWAACFLAHGLEVVAYDPSPGAPDLMRRMVEQAWPVLRRNSRDTGDTWEMQLAWTRRTGNGWSEKRLSTQAVSAPALKDLDETASFAFRLETTRERTGRGFRGVLTMTGRPRRPLPTIIVQYRMREGLDTPAGLATIRVGDAAFDDAFVVHASREDEAKTLLTPALRELLLGDPSSAVLRAEMLRVSEAEVALSYPAVAPGLYEPSRLESIARQVLALCG